MILRPFQQRAIQTLRQHSHEHVLGVAPTGAGKGTILSEIVRLASEKGRRVLFLADREELVADQARRMAALRPGILKAGYVEDRSRPVQIGSVQTLNRRDLPPADLVIADEADLFLAATYKRILDAYPDATRLGMTASPARLDGKGLGAVFTKLVVLATTEELLKDGYLHEPRYFAPREPSLDSVAKQAGDFNQRDLAEKYIVGDVVEHWLRLARNKRTLAFGVNRAHAESIANQFQAQGIPARYVDGDTDPRVRRLALEELDSGELMVLSNVGLFGRGTDIPKLECVLDCAPTLSVPKFRQRLGRVTRPWPGKEAVYIDHASNVLRHGRLIDEPEWSLADKVKRAPLKSLHRCKSCFAIFLGSRCGCGYVAPVTKPEPVKHERGSLEELQAFKPLSDKESAVADKLAGWIKETKEKGYKPRYAQARFREEYGFWPPRRLLAFAEKRSRDPARDPGVVSV